MISPHHTPGYIVTEYYGDQGGKSRILEGLITRLQPLGTELWRVGVYLCASSFLVHLVVVVASVFESSSECAIGVLRHSRFLFGDSSSVIHAAVATSFCFALGFVGAEEKVTANQSVTSRSD